MTAVDVEQAWSVVDETTSAIERVGGRLDALYERRRDAFHVLLDAGERQADIARRAGITPMAVAYAVGKVRKRAPRATH